MRTFTEDSGADEDAMATREMVLSRLVVYTLETFYLHHNTNLLRVFKVERYTSDSYLDSPACLYTPSDNSGDAVCLLYIYWGVGLIAIPNCV